MIAVPVEDIVSDLECKHANMSVQDRAGLPKRLHYAYNDRIDDIPLVMEESWQVERSVRSVMIFVGDHLIQY